ncbi:Spindle assembly checkpoint component MAD1 [Paragonimus westermani]|uniref:Spindle assembly checkpoint component MAD1 n=1 Tax=Paragonimus westermani TaxID=34504 RepID=A0A8T0DWP9_9TREM|nr:Spindle assembly checkpoint component MAD1 [Paragonimus westermani]
MQACRLYGRYDGFCTEAEPDVHKRTDLMELLEIERERRKNCESQCSTLMLELESRELQLEHLKNTLLTRVSDAESQMKKLIRLRDEETIKAEKATTKLRTSISKLQQKYEGEKQELHEALRSVRDSNEQQILSLQSLLKKSETDKENLMSKLQKSETSVTKLSNELTQLRKEHNQNCSRITQLTHENNELSINATKYKGVYQKACSRSEIAAKQIGDLRKQLEQASLAQTQSEQSMRTANERRIAAESALTAVRQRTDAQSQRLNQLERELATEKARADEKSNSHDAEVQKLRRRLLAVQSEAVKWKRAWQSERTTREDQITHANQAIQNMLDERAQLESDLKQSREKATEQLKMIEQLQRQAALEATNASSRLLVALSTGEEGVNTALELKRCIEEQLQPELENTKQQCLQAQTEAAEWRRKHEQLHLDLTRCHDAAQQLELRLTERQSAVEHELATLRQQLTKVEEEMRLKSALLTKAEEQVQRYEADLTELRTTQQTFRASTNEQLAELQSVHEATVERLNMAQRLITRLKSARDTALTGLARTQVELKESHDAHELSNRQKIEELNAVKLELNSMRQKLTSTESELHQMHEDSAKQMLRNNEEYEFTISQLNQQLSAETQKSEQYQIWISDLRKQLADAEFEHKSVLDERMLDDRRLEESERKVRQLEIELSERNHELEKLQLEVTERSRLLDLRAHDLQELQSTIITRMTEAQKAVESARSQQVEGELETQLLAGRLKEAEETAAAGEQQRKQMSVHIMELENELAKHNQSRTEQAAEHDRNQSELREDLLRQLHEAQQQRDLSTECLREANHFLVEQTAAKQSLMEKMREMQDEYEQTHTQSKRDLAASDRERAALQQQVNETSAQLVHARTLVEEAVERVARLESENKRAERQSQQLALEVASKNAVAAATASSLMHLKPTDNLRIAWGRSGDVDVGNYLSSERQHLSGAPKMCDSDYQPPVFRRRLSTESSSLNHPCAGSDNNGTEHRKVTFAPLPVKKTTESARTTSSAASDLEQLIREVTQKLDDEVLWD